jgi:sulfoxide reductase heme-binding subunit YedZ
MAASPAGARIWRSLHSLAYVAWTFAMVHGFESGTDSGVTWVRALYVICLVAVTGSVWARLASLSGRADPRRDLVAGPHAANSTRKALAR